MSWEACYMDVATESKGHLTRFRKARRSHASASPVPGEGTTPERPGQTENTNLLGMLDREELREAKTHLVWVGRLSKMEER
jgi:hypothetical protein